MADVLVDTSVWIAFFRRGTPEGMRSALVDLLERDAVVVLDPVIAELLYGVRDVRERRTILDVAEGVRKGKIDGATWVASGDLGRAWRARGRTLSLVDCLIAAVASRDGLPLWTLDADFEPLFADGAVQRFL